VGVGEFAQSAAPGAGAVAVGVCVCVCVVCVVCMYAHSVGQRVNGMSVRVCVVVWCVLHVWCVYMRTVCASVSVSSAPVYGCASVRPPKCPNASSKKNALTCVCLRVRGVWARSCAQVLVFCACGRGALMGTVPLGGRRRLRRVKVL